MPGKYLENGKYICLFALLLYKAKRAKTFLQSESYFLTLSMFLPPEQWVLVTWLRFLVTGLPSRQMSVQSQRDSARAKAFGPLL